MCKGKIYQQFKDLRIYKDLYGKPLKCDCVVRVVFLIQLLLIFSGRCNCYFWDIWLEIYRLPNFNRIFQLVLLKLFKSGLFLCNIECIHRMSRCSKTKKRWPHWSSKQIPWELDSFLMQKISFVPITLHR